MDEIIKIDSGVSGADETDLIQITQFAIDTIKSSMSTNKVPSEYFVRIKSASGGCQGMNFSLEFDFEFSEELDREFIANGVRIVCDSKTVFYLMGITVDYIDDEEMSGFVFRGYRDYPVCGCKS